MFKRLIAVTEDNLRKIWSDRPRGVVSTIFQFIGAISSIAFIFAYFNFGADALKKVLVEVVGRIWSSTQAAEVPRIIWIVLVVFAGYMFFLKRRVNLVAGTFSDDFSNGLVNWEYGGEGWTTRRGEKGYELSITNSGGGGISNFGFWDSYVFSFECKVVNRNVGWIVRATDRANYFMIQLSLPNENKEYTSINPHFLANEEWLVIEKRLQVSKELTEKILAHDWLNVEIVVFGNVVDVFINKERVLNYHIPDPLRILKEQLDVSKKVKAFKEYEAFSFPAGRIGFRCFQEEHALIRNVRVEPKFWNSRRI